MVDDNREKPKENPAEFFVLKLLTALKLFLPLPAFITTTTTNYSNF